MGEGGGVEEREEEEVEVREGETREMIRGERVWGEEYGEKGRGANER